MNNSLRYLIILPTLACALNAHAAPAGDSGLNVGGFFFFGTGFSNDPKLNPGGYDWSKTGNNIFRLSGFPHGNTSGGRLGNDGNWAQIHIDYTHPEKNDSQWGTHFMFSSDSFSTWIPEHAFVDAKGLFHSSPDAKVWVGKKYVSRVSTPLTSLEAIASDGTGFGMEDYNLGNGKLALSVTRNLYNAYSSNPLPGYMTAFSSSISDINAFGDIKADLYANFGTYMGPNGDDVITGTNPENKTHKDVNPDAYQMAFRLRQGDYLNGHDFFVRYGSNTRQVITRTESYSPAIPSEQIGAFLTGRFQLTNNYRLEYTLQHEKELFDAEAIANSELRKTYVTGTSSAEYKESNWSAFIVKQSYQWSEQSSTQLELGYEEIEFDAINSSNSGLNSGYKATLAQNIHLGSGFWDRPILSFYVTYAELDTNTTVDNLAVDDTAALGEQNAITVGAAVESWF